MTFKVLEYKFSRWSWLSLLLWQAQQGLRKQNSLLIIRFLQGHFRVSERIMKRMALVSLLHADMIQIRTLTKAALKPPSMVATPLQPNLFPKPDF